MTLKTKATLYAKYYDRLINSFLFLWIYIQKSLRKTFSSWSRFIKRHIILNGIFSKWLTPQKDLKVHNVITPWCKIILVLILIALTQLIADRGKEVKLKMSTTDKRNKKEFYYIKNTKLLWFWTLLLITTMDLW